MNSMQYFRQTSERIYIQYFKALFAIVDNRETIFTWHFLMHSKLVAIVGSLKSILPYILRIIFFLICIVLRQEAPPSGMLSK